ncbi:ornithine carbamoyltransferase [Candidatus Izimaplasma bacterium ZiA1]|uniref:ornithine carbamoyltransferase n=1 Tax=Candidatus Izimoplasma sp. ZiA1 TaxID=2024899 RepID=UPI000BAA51AD|nr:ornithine carbamoyltransferase [Candidatus Izimaplasma bacterium ZiA1]
MNLKGRNFITLLDFTSEEITHLINLSAKLKEDKYNGKEHKVLSDKNVVLLFQKDSTRTRCAFEVGAMDLGMGVTYLGPNGSQMNTKESVKDTARVLGRMYDGIEFRGYKQSDVEALGANAGVPVWNGLTDVYHPTQILADFLTIKEVFGKLKGINFTYVGDSRNNMGNSLMIGAAKQGLNFTGVAPKELWPDQKLIDTCLEIAKEHGSTIHFTEDKMEGTKNADVVYADVWVSMGEPKEVWETRIAQLNEYQVDMEMMNNAKDTAIFMHCLPAFHGKDTEVGKKIAEGFGDKFPKVKNGEMEVTDEVIESECSVVFQEAENRMHTIKAVMLATLRESYE